MARIVNIEEHAVRRNDILDTAQRLVYTKGYEQVSIQDILAESHISKGAFYHYFDSKQSLLEALIKRMGHQVEQLLIPIVDDETLPAMVKLQRFFDVAVQWKTERKDYLLSLVNVWYSDENAILRQKVQTALIWEVTDLLTKIISQGVREGVFQTNYPEQDSEIIFTVLLGFGDTLAKLIFQPGFLPEGQSQLDNLSASYQDAVERILGADSGSLPLFDTAILREWFPLSNL